MYTRLTKLPRTKAGGLFLGRPRACRELNEDHWELKQLTGQGGSGEGSQHFSELQTLNKQKINIQYFYKLQHYETVGHQLRRGNLQYLQPQL